MLSSMKINKGVLLIIMLLNLSCLSNTASSNVTCIDRERQALLDFKRGFDVKLSHVVSSWKGEDCCQWQGVKCNNKTGHVISLSLGYAGLKGKIVNSLLELKDLTHLDLRGSALDNIPSFIGSLSKLTYLNLSQVHYPSTKLIPAELGNLNSLQVLDLGYSSNIKWYDNYIYNPTSSLGDFNGLTSNNLSWVSKLSSLQYLDLSHVRLSNASNWLSSIANLHFLKHLQMYNCHLPMPEPIPFSSFSDVRYLTELSFLRLGTNRLNSDIFDWFSNISTNLNHLDLRGNLFSGKLPDILWNVTSLEFLDLSDNAFEGDLPRDLLQRLPSLAHLSIARNNFSGQFPEFRADGNKTSLQTFDMSSNRFSGNIPAFLGDISSLTKLNLSYNQFKGAIPKSFSKLQNLQLLDLSSNGLGDTEFNVSFFDSISQLYNLRDLDVSSNKLYGTISEIHLNSFVHLSVFDTSDNFITLNFSRDWIPPFQQAKLLMLGSCNVGQEFPRWVMTLNRLSTLDLSNCAISDEIPDGFWKHFSGSNIEYLNMSNNKIHGSLPKDLLLNSTQFRMTIIDLSHNLLNGSIPPTLMNSTTLSLSNNMFSGSISSLCTAPRGNLMSLDLSSNLLSGTIPDCWEQWGSLSILNLANNSFSGEVPKSIGSLPFLRALHLRKNNLYGRLPYSLKNCSSLQVLDLDDNNFSGSIPVWIGKKLKNLLVLSMRKNQVSGKIPSSLCGISTLHVLDLSVNSLSGTIPRCFDNFTAMSKGWSFNPYFVQPICLGYSFWGSAQYADILLLELKGIEREINSKSILINFIDLSHNKLTGEIPEGLTRLVNLISLNLSRNHLIGRIPNDIGQITSLDALDLSRNRLDGEIPSGLSSLSQLGTLDLSYNDLAGRIPPGTQLQSFEALSFVGNPGLCGSPLSACPEDEKPTLMSPGVGGTEKDDDSEIWMRQFYISMVIGSVVGFCCVFFASLKILRQEHSRTVQGRLKSGCCLSDIIESWI
ncbi:receptor-like protein EIX2 [Silene latifolia]|uniref:receptor-like protein EIX2 n=1 Tax=Silene latifolia TaxID=37657 RepID=UPI003D771EF9